MHDAASSTLLTLRNCQQPYRINNCKFQNSMISFLSELHSSKAYTDVVLHAEGKLLHAHKLVLAAGSSYFNNLFKSVIPPPPDQQACSTNLVIALPSVSFKDLDRVVKFIYLGYLDIVNSELEGFVNLAKQLGVVGMSDGDDSDQQQQYEDSGSEQDQVEPEQKHEPQNYEPEQVDQTEDSQEEPPPPTLSPPLLPHPHPQNQALPTLPNEYVQVSYTDEEDEDLTGYPLDDEMDDDEYTIDNSHTSTANSRLFAGSGTEKPFHCVKCGKTYNSNKSLWRHKKFTCDEKIEFKCTVCGKVFSRSDNLRRHVVVAHSHS